MLRSIFNMHEHCRPRKTSLIQNISAPHPDPELPYILALDVGTSSTRAVLVDRNGNTLPHVLAQHPYQRTMSSEGEVSVDPDVLLEIVARTVDDALNMAGPLAQHIEAVAVD